MSIIQLLYIIPVIAFGVMGFLVAWVIQHERRRMNSAPANKDLKREVDEYNSGSSLGDISPESAVTQRLRDIESTIALVNSVLSSQQKIVEKFEGQSATYGKELTVLRQRLAELSREYDLIAGENKALRATIRQLLRRHSVDGIGRSATGGVKARQILTEEEFYSETERRLFEDTKQLRVLGLGGESTESTGSSFDAID